MHYRSGLFKSMFSRCIQRTLHTAQCSTGELPLGEHHNYAALLVDFINLLHPLTYWCNLVMDKAKWGQQRVWRLNHGPSLQDPHQSQEEPCLGRNLHFSSSDTNSKWLTIYLSIYHFSLLFIFIYLPFIYPSVYPSTYHLSGICDVPWISSAMITKKHRRGKFHNSSENRKSLH